jgi:hypothetical protein
MYIGRKSSAVVKDGNEGQKSVKKEKMDLNPPKVRAMISMNVCCVYV